jgi:hypothetical protein
MPGIGAWFRQRDIKAPAAIVPSMVSEQSGAAQIMVSSAPTTRHGLRSCVGSCRRCDRMDAITVSSAGLPTESIRSSSSQNEADYRAVVQRDAAGLAAQIGRSLAAQTPASPSRRDLTRPGWPTRAWRPCLTIPSSATTRWTHWMVSPLRGRDRRDRTIVLDGVPPGTPHARPTGLSPLRGSENRIVGSSRRTLGLNPRRLKPGSAASSATSDIELERVEESMAHEIRGLDRRATGPRASRAIGRAARVVGGRLSQGEEVNCYLLSTTRATWTMTL